MFRQKVHICLGLLCYLWQGVIAEVTSEPLYAFKEGQASAWV
ncbi:hypothetical protein [Candidatus Venteria ishoeyi]|uniref:Uncharacterized protein n=1 Tax=Candidatus Venteria ishoeyi TaxID=1899563 RepID=A0A1H6FG57_9GAMM|nr:hypothetical protein [Candidatus Venteria ishoeyi]SEH08633.1 Uncharacterised protein [Candidatus Venteria ishoeyi]